MNDLSSADVIEETPAYRRSRLRGGPSDGVEVVHLRRGGAECVVCPTRGMGVLSLTVDGVTAAWDSPVPGPVHPFLVNLQSRGGLGWLDGFSELLVRCGLNFNGPPGDDEAAGPIEREVTLHGRIANVPASDVTIGEAADGLCIRGTVTEATLFGPRLELATEITLNDAGELIVRDTVTNRAARPTEVQLIYHVNVGRPFLEEGSLVRASAATVSPRDERAAEDLDAWDQCLGPTEDYAEQAYFLRPVNGADGMTIASLSNAAGDRTFSVRFDAQQLPCLTVWKCTQPEADGYVLGLEPGLNFPNFKAVEREQGRVRRLSPGESFTTTVRLTVHDSPPEVATTPEIVD